jgi:hypothetical protein
MLVRISNGFRMKYRVEPGLYALGCAGSDSPVFVSANYRLSFNILRRALTGMNAWILVLDTKGINVWCAAGKGSFGTAELSNRIKLTGLSEKVNHRRVIVPQLGAPGLVSQEVLKQSGFRVVFGPVLADDIPAFMAADCKATPEMRTVRFGLADRAVLFPFEVSHSLKFALPAALALCALAGVNASGFSFSRMLQQGPVLAASVGLGLVSGAVLTPLLLPWIPFRAFALKGVLMGIVCAVPALIATELASVKALILLLVPTFSSYLAFNFTGCTTFTNPSGVKKELKLAWPLYLISSASMLALLVLYKFQTWR